MMLWLADLHQSFFSVRGESATYVFKGHCAYLYHVKADAESSLRFVRLPGKWEVFEIPDLKEWLSELDTKQVELILEIRERPRPRAQNFMENSSFRSVKGELQRFHDDRSRTQD